MAKRFLVDLHFQSPKVQKELPLAEDKIKKLITKSLEALEFSDEYVNWTSMMSRAATGLSIMFCDDKKMREYHGTYKKVVRTTDILSFPSFEALDKMELELHDGGLGDLVVSLECVRRHANGYKRLFAHELIEVLIHGLLHLLGCEHVHGGAEAHRMRSLQESLFLAIKASI